MQRSENITGFTLLELLMVVSIAAVLATVAVPAMVDLVNGARMTTTVNRFMAALRVARSEAIRSGQRVTVCPLAPSGGCADTGLEEGWVIVPGSDPFAVSSLAVARFEGAPSRIRIDYRFGNVSADYISYMPTGDTRRLTGAMLMGSVRFCDGRHDRHIIVSASGRARVVRRACSD